MIITAPGDNCRFKYSCETLLMQMVFSTGVKEYLSMSVACEISACILLFMIYEHWSLISYSGALNTEDPLFLPMKTCSRDAAVGSTQQVIARRCLLCTYWDAILAAYMPSRGFSPQNSFQLVEGRTFQILNCKAPLCCGSLNVKN